MEKNMDFNSVKQFIKHNYRHFNSAVVIDASQSYIDLLSKGGKMMLTMAGAMSTAEIGITLAEMIRNDKVHAITCTGANLEEDLFNLVAHDFYERVPHYRYLSPKDEEKLLKKGMNRVTDTCIPEMEAMRRIEGEITKFWQKAEKEGKRYFPYEFVFQLLESGNLKKYYQIDPKDSWLIAACEKQIPVFVPGWEDSTLGNYLVTARRENLVKSFSMVKSGLELFDYLIDWYLENSEKSDIGFFQIGGGITGDFSICVVPSIIQDMKINCKFWSYFCQISDSTTSYGSYSGATPNEKITWGKIGVNTPMFVIESDATIVLPLIFAYILAE